MSDDIRRRIVDNIYAEALQHVRSDGLSPIGVRGPEWQAVIEEALSVARAQVNKEQIEAGRRKYELKMKRLEANERKLAAKSNMTYEEWLEEAKKFYSINPDNYLVTSVARSPNTPPETWECKDEYEARHTVLKLLRYKQYDHFTRGGNFAYTIEGEKDGLHD